MIKLYLIKIDLCIYLIRILYLLYKSELTHELINPIDRTWSPYKLNNQY